MSGQQPEPETLSFSGFASPQAMVLPPESMVTDGQVTPARDGWHIAFKAMASPCELLVDGGDAALAADLLTLARGEALRIERKFSRYRDDSVLAGLHRHAAEHPGAPALVDTETAALLDLAAQCHALSDGRFDITSGVLRRAWTFDGSDHLPTADAVQACLALVGWPRLAWQPPWLTLAPGMQLDFGGIAKEYAVDRVLSLVMQRCHLPVLVNFGGDLAVSGAQRDGQPWRVGIERPADAAGPALPGQAPGEMPGEAPGEMPGVMPGDDAPTAPGQLVLELAAGALATSGDARRFLLKDGVRYGHILDPRTGWPVPGAPRSVTVAAGTCTEAGLFSTLAMLQGPGAEAFLREQGLPFWVLR
jgi:thiamine biosynthesis lipoprotein